MVRSAQRFRGGGDPRRPQVGTEGKLGGQANVLGVAGTLEGSDRERQLDGVEPDQSGPQHRRPCSTAIANGDLSKKITVDVSGEILELKETINTMVDQLNAFCRQK